MDLLHANDRDGAYPDSYYASTVAEPAGYAPAKGHVHTDVCVVGGGYTGLSAALHLARQGFDVALLDAQRVGFGASGRNGGQVATGQRLEQSVLEARYGKETARELFKIAQDARALVDTLVQEGIDCDLEAGVIYATHRAAEVSEFHDEAALLRDEYGVESVEPLGAAEAQRLIGSALYQGGVLDRGAAYLNPLKLVLGLANAAHAAGVQIFEQSRVRAIADTGPHVTLQSDDATITAEHVVLAGNGYLDGLDRTIQSHVMPINSFMVATEPLGPQTDTILPERHAVADSRFVVNYFRLSPEGRLLFGGGESYGYRFPRDIAEKVRRPLEEVFPQLKGVRIDYAWGGTLAITRSRMPFVRRVQPRVLSAGGYSGHGIAMGLLAGRAIAETLCGNSTTFDRLATLPATPFPGGAQLRNPLLMLGMTAAALRDRLPI